MKIYAHSGSIWWKIELKYHITGGLEILITAEYLQ